MSLQEVAVCMYVGSKRIHLRYFFGVFVQSSLQFALQIEQKKLQICVGKQNKLALLEFLSCLSVSL
jgi:hypothetical protein